MKSTITEMEIEGKVDKLLDCLENDSQHIQHSLSQLNKLRSFVIKRDDSGLGTLLKIIQAESEDYRNQETKREKIRKELADALGYDVKQLTLSVLEANSSGQRKSQVMEKKTKLMSLVKELKKEHFNTALLLSECARFNNLLLKSIFDLGKTETVYYNSTGATKKQTDTNFVNLRL
jgi:hypothetical protein